jgi:hypothetical protein
MATPILEVWGLETYILDWWNVQRMPAAPKILIVLVA